MGRLFGTDGVRGVAGSDLTPELALQLAVAAARELLSDDGGERPMVVVGRDPRPSGEFLEAAVVAGLLAAGADVTSLGVVPTPAVAYAVNAGLSAGPAPALGVMISASHNPMPDNGIKLFGPGGRKLADAVEDAVADRFAEPWPAHERPTGRHVGRLYPEGDVTAQYGDWYVEHLLATLPHPLNGLRVVLDCANGAARSAAPTALRRAGAEVMVIHDSPGGYAINRGCGATHLESLQRAVLEHGAHAGIAHDGDADRCLAVDATGGVVDGDQILAICALALRAAGRLAGDAVATTVMTNLGFHRAMAERGIRVVETSVGDRYVLAALDEHGLVLGGEQSGHIVFLEHAATGDGILTALHLLAQLAATGRSLADLARVMQRLPQVLVNVPASRAAAGHPDVLAAVIRAEAELGDKGRVLLRASGTEPLVRVMVEASDEPSAERIARQVAAAVHAVG